ncbi:hypothetical protein [Providencia heimbachae]|nr:hypothetical protein [Providencia heimbachae]
MIWLAERSQQTCDTKNDEDRLIDGDELTTNPLRQLLLVIKPLMLLD